LENLRGVFSKKTPRKDFPRFEEKEKKFRGRGPVFYPKQGGPTTRAKAQRHKGLTKGETNALMKVRYPLPQKGKSGPWKKGNKKGRFNPEVLRRNQLDGLISQSNN